jgi:uncharacterized membrane protein (UPF0182 family)
VNGEPQLQILQLPTDTQVSGPGQADQKMTNDNGVRPQISLLQNSATVIYGNLLSLPVGGGMLYVEPLYVQSKAQNAYPQLKYVLVNFGQYVGFADSLQGALTQLLNTARSGGATPPTGPPPNANQPPPSQTNAEVDAATQRIDKALTDLKSAQQSGDFTKYGEALQELNDAITAYQQARQSASPSPSGTPSPGSSASPSGTPSVAPSG